MWFIFMIILTIINLIIFHSFFIVIHFDLKKGIIGEIVGAWIIACLEAAAISILWSKIAPVVIALLIIAAIIAVILITISIIVRKVNKKNDN